VGAHSPSDAVLLSNDLVLARHLTRLDLSDNFIGVEGAAALADALTPAAHHPFNHTLTALDLSGNWLYDDSARMLAVPLTPHPDTGVYNTALADLRLAGCRLGPPGAAALAAVLLKSERGCFNTSLTALDVSSNELCAGGGGVRGAAGEPAADVSGVEVLARALQQVSSSRLRTLNLWQGGLPEAAALLLTAPLAAQGVRVKLCGHLLDTRHLNVSGRGLTPADAVLLANDLVQSDGCESLDAADNSLGPHGAALLAAALLPDETTGACNRR
jgi:Ran GTPase-activating protein (RanGAP) involved in mRNA processing and transport